MPFEEPEASFHDDHIRGSGAQAPDCLIRAWLLCPPGNCGSEAATVQAVEDSTGTVLGEMPVSCTDEWKLHEIPMAVGRTLQATKVRLRFTCGTEVVDGLRNRIWIRCAKP